MSQATVQQPQPTAAAPARPNSAQNAPEASASAGQVQGQSRMPKVELLRRQMAHCGEYTFQALNKTGKLSPEDTGRITQQYLKYLNTVEKGKPFMDALVFLYFEGWRRPDIDSKDTILKLTRSLIAYSKTKISHLSFVQQTDTPVEFYSSFPVVSEICRLLATPVIQINEKDFFTVTSVNPFTAMAASRLVANEIQQEIGRKPFSFVTTTDIGAWKYLLGRHFGA